MLRERGVGIWGDVSPKGSEAKETWGDKGREGTPKNGNMGRRLLWMVPNALSIYMLVHLVTLYISI